MANISEELEGLLRLRDAGHLSAGEFEQQRLRLLGASGHGRITGLGFFAGFLTAVALMAMFIAAIANA